MAQSIVKRGSVVSIRYPFTDLTGAKVRPALVVTGARLALRQSLFRRLAGYLSGYPF